jgi:hypothetical protein
MTKPNGAVVIPTKEGIHVKDYIKMDARFGYYLRSVFQQTLNFNGLRLVLQ